MSAPSSSRPPSAVLALAIMVGVMLLLAGCSAPGLGRLQERPPKTLSPVMKLVTADALGYSLYQTDPDSKAWRAIDDGTRIPAARRALTKLHAPLTRDGGEGPRGGDGVDLDEIARWIGPSAGMLLHVLPERGTELPESTMYFAEVAHRDQLETYLTSQGWKRTTSADDKLGMSLAAWTRTGPGAATQLGALGIRDDALIAAGSMEGLALLTAAARTYAVPERSAMANYTVDALERSPMSVIFRADFSRRQLIRTVQADPALRELARWATETMLLDALRDGWIGCAPTADDSRAGLRLIASADWLAHLSTRFELTAANRAMLTQLPRSVTHAVSLNDPGAIAIDAVTEIASNRLQYVTEADAMDGEDMSLLDVLGQLDGDAAIGLDRAATTLHMSLDNAQGAGVAKQVTDTLAYAELPGRASAEGRTVQLVLPLGSGDATVDPAPDGPPLINPDAIDAEFAAAGQPPFTAIAWLWRAPDACAGRAAGWIAFDEKIDMRASIDLDLTSSPACTDTSLLDRLFPD
ncbi:MAG: hypothetical protein ABI200_01840 [Gaiellales bacterium]